jgi:hypothetical protein
MDPRPDPHPDLYQNLMDPQHWRADSRPTSCVPVCVGGALLRFLFPGVQPDGGVSAVAAAAPPRHLLHARPLLPSHLVGRTLHTSGALPGGRSQVG